MRNPNRYVIVEKQVGSFFPPRFFAVKEMGHPCLPNTKYICLFISFLYIATVKKRNEPKKRKPRRHLDLRSGQCNCFAVAPSSRGTICDGLHVLSSRTLPSHKTILNRFASAECHIDILHA